MQKEITDKIAETIRNKIRPVLAMDGGDIEFIDYDEKEKIVKVRLHGACYGCPLAGLTLKRSVEGILKDYFPEDVESVEQVIDIEEDIEENLDDEDK